MTQPVHLSPELIAAYLAGEATPPEHRAAQAHLLACADCRLDMADAAELGTGRTPRRWLPVIIPAAAAAVVALFVFLPGPGNAPDGPVTRGPGTEGVRQFVAVAPAMGAIVAGDSVVFRWRSEGPQVHYVLTVTDESGDVVWTAALPDTAVAPPRNVGLQPGTRYFWYVDALLANARSSTTGVREFRVRP